ncbi:MAG: hypothetical protein JRN15_15410 [Nitrososphaerota archaeon]|nr:hypothetical protein [Nitrososphaerota archaeon]
MKAVIRFQAVAMLLFFSSLSFAQQNSGMQVIHSQLLSIINQQALTPVGPMDSTAHLDLVITLALRNQQKLSTLLHNLYDPTSPEYHQFLSHPQFVSEFGPSQASYDQVVSFAKANGFTVTRTTADRMLVDLNGSVPVLEKALHVNLLMYNHPTQNRKFYAPDRNPSINLSVPVLAIYGLSDYYIQRPADLQKSSGKGNHQTPDVGTGPNNSYIGNDFRAAYAPGVSLNGHGQKVGLLQLSSDFYQRDITSYDSLAGLLDVPVGRVFPDNYPGGYQGGSVDGYGATIEVSLDIEMATSMAPGLDSIIVFEGTNWPDILNAMGANTSIKQFSASWTFYGDSPSYSSYFDALAVQGQSFFSASGDGGAWGSSPVIGDPKVTIVGGTALSTTAPGGQWSSETAANFSGGGFDSNFPLPSYQQGIANPSSTLRGKKR